VDAGDPDRRYEAVDRRGIGPGNASAHLEPCDHRVRSGAAAPCIRSLGERLVLRTRRGASLVELLLPSPTRSKSSSGRHAHGDLVQGQTDQNVPPIPSTGPALPVLSRVNAAMGTREKSEPRDADGAVGL
jgi:hypothetical protein